MMPVTLEAKKKKDLLGELDKIPTSRMYRAGQRALMRLHLYSTGRIHQAILDFTDKVRSTIVKNAGSDGALTSTGVYKAERAILDAWADTFDGLRSDLMNEREEATRIAFGVMAMMHERLLSGVRDQAPDVAEARTGGGGAFDPQLRILLNTAAEYLYGDGLNLSGRIWKLDRETRDGINRVLLNGLSTQDSAWNIAKQLEQFLGPNADCPRWTSTRLYGRTKSDIASGDPTGLLRGDDCDGRGVAYNALRLARTEIQKIHALATDRMLAQQPWVKKEQVHLSAAHPGSDICDETVAAGEDGKGIYEVGTVELPFHPNCLCYKTAVLMDAKEFTSQLKGWMDGSQAWAEMDEYEKSIGGDISISLLPEAINLAVWMFGGLDELSS